MNAVFENETKLVRLWSIAGKKWIENFAITNKGDIVSVTNQDTNGLGYISRYIGEEAQFIRNNYIHIDDRIKKQIFEDDIVLKFCKNEVGDLRNGIIGVVKYVAPNYLLMTYEGMIPLASCDDLEVIGNIRETPEKFTANHSIF
jgi:hypothetical protein